MISITYGILTHQEESVFYLLDQIVKIKDEQDRIIVVDNESDESYLKKLRQYPLRLIKRKLNLDYSAQRNAAVVAANTNYMFQLDADELMTNELATNLKAILNSHNPDAVWIPRVNILKGIKPVHALQYNYTLSPGEVINYPDYQCRLIKLKKGIRWVGKAHERPLLNPKRHHIIQLPINQNLDIIHTKTIEQQIAQNERVDQLYTPEEANGSATKKLLASQS